MTKFKELFEDDLGDIEGAFKLLKKIKAGRYYSKNKVMLNNLNAMMLHFEDAIYDSEENNQTTKFSDMQFRNK